MRRLASVCICMMTGNRSITAFLLWRMVLNVCLPVILLSMTVSCEHRPLLDPVNSHYVRVYLDEEVKNITCGFYDEAARQPYQRPDIIRVLLYDRSSGNQVSERYLRYAGTDDRGAYCDGYISCLAGQYEMLAYSFGTEATIVSNDQKLSTLYAYTNDITINPTRYMPRSSEPAAPGVHTPDHVFVARASVDVGQKAYVDTLKSTDGEWRFKARTVVDSYYVRMRLKGAQYVSSASALLSGLAGGKLLWGEERIGGPVSILFDMKMTEVSGDEAYIYATFSTFGLYSREADTSPGTNDHILSGDGQTLLFSIKNIAGGLMAAKIDISAEFDKPLAKEKNWILLDKMIVIEDPAPPVEGGGFSPGVENWTDVVTDIII